MSDHVEPVEATAEEITDDATTPGTAVEVAQRTPGGLIRANEPEEILAKAAKIATALKALIEAQGLSVDVGGKRKHVEVGGWQALGTLLGALGGEPLHAETIWTRPLRDPVTGDLLVTRYPVKTVTKKYGNVGNGRRGVVQETEAFYEVDGHDWEARVEIRTASGVLVGRAEAMVSRKEHAWSRRDDYALRSMAETRAESRAYRKAAGWVVNLAGYDPTPLEEIPPEQRAEAAKAAPKPAAAAKKLPAKKVDELHRIMGQLVTRKLWTPEFVSMQLTAHGATDSSGVKPAIASLTEEAAEKLKATMVDALAKASDDDDGQTALGVTG